MKPKKCFICNKEFIDVSQLANHLENAHDNVIPDGWSGGKYYFNHIHGRTYGKCVVCGGKTEFNENTFKPYRLCKNSQCKLKMRENAKNNMIKKYGKETLLDDPEYQKTKMLANRKIAKDYKWSNGKTLKVIGSFEYDFARFCDVFLDMEYEDVIMPAPFVIEYEYDNNKHFYIPDCYIQSLNLVVEIKDGGDNPNTHPKIMAVDKVKEKIKDKAVMKLNKYNYIKIENKQYGDFIEIIRNIKNMDFLPSSPKYKPVTIENHHIIINEDVNTVDYVLKPKIVQYDNSRYGIVTDTLDKFSYNPNTNRLEKTDAYVNNIYNIANLDTSRLTTGNIQSIITSDIVNNSEIDLLSHPLYFVYELYNKITGEYCDITDVTPVNVKVNDSDDTDIEVSMENLFNDILDEIDELSIESTTLDEVYDEYNNTDMTIKNKQNYISLLENVISGNTVICLDEGTFDCPFPKLGKFLIENNNVKLLDESDDDFVTQSIPIGRNLADSTSVNIKTRKFNVSISKENLKLILSNTYDDYHKLFQESKKLLPVYLKHNNVDGIKYELAKLHFLTVICDEYIHKGDQMIFKFNKDKNKFISLKSFVVPLFNKYLDDIMKIDNTFNFTQYYDQTEFATIDIDINFNFPLLRKFHKLFKK